MKNMNRTLVFVLVLLIVCFITFSFVMIDTSVILASFGTAAWYWQIAQINVVAIVILLFAIILLAIELGKTAKNN